MTTYVISGQMLLIDSTGPSVVYTDAVPIELRIVMPDATTTFSYDTFGSGPGFLDAVTFDFNNPLDISIVGPDFIIDSSEYNNFEAQLGTLELPGGGSTTDLLNLYTFNDPDSAFRDFWFDLGGTPLPNFASGPEMGTYLEDLVTIGGIQSGPFMEDIPIQYSAFPTVTILAGNVFTGNEFANTLTGTSEDDTINGLGGNDILDGGAGDNTINGGAGIDTLSFASSLVSSGFTLMDQGVSTFTGDGNDIITGIENLLGSAQADLLSGDNGNNVIEGGAGGDGLDGAGGIDTVSYAGSSAGVTVSISGPMGSASGGDAAGDVLVSFENIIGSDHADSLTGNSATNVLTGGLGNDRYFVDSAADVVVEAAGEGIGDYIFSSVSNTIVENIERLYLTGTDSIDATGRDGANDILVGNSGNNTLDGKGGRDIMQGRGGNDIYFVDQLTDVVTENAGEGTDFIFTTGSFQIAENAERLVAVEGEAAAYGLTARNFQNDIIIGNSSTNVFVDQFGRDIFVGGGGADFFRFIANLDPVNNVNRINDFNSADDQFQLLRLIYTEIDVGILDASEFVLGTAASDADDRIIYDQPNGVLYYDPDGTGAAAQIEIVNVTAGITITADDFQIY